ncbi:MAG: hypothetical protein Q9210_006557 [Variospora velana]
MMQSIPVSQEYDWLPFSYGVFQKYYSEHEPFSQNPHGIAVVGTTTTGLLYFLSPVAVLALQTMAYPPYADDTAGLALITISLSIASFSTQVTELVMTQRSTIRHRRSLRLQPFYILPG